MADITWLPTPTADNANAAANYLKLTGSGKAAKKMAAKLLTQDPQTYQAKDILRAAGATPSDPANPQVAKYLNLVSLGTPIAPVFLVRGNAAKNQPLQIADGFHRISAAYSLDPTTQVACQITKPC